MVMNDCPDISRFHHPDGRSCDWLFLLAPDNRVLAHLRDPEFYNTFGRDFYHLTGLRVAPLPCFAIHQDEFAESGNGKGILGFPIGNLGQLIEKLGGSFFCQT